MGEILRSGYSTKDYSLTGYVWSAVNLSPEHLGHGISLKVTVVYDSLQEPLTFTCDCNLPLVLPRWICSSTRHCATLMMNCVTLMWKTLYSNFVAWRNSCKSKQVENTCAENKGCSLKPIYMGFSHHLAQKAHIFPKGVIKHPLGSHEYIQHCRKFDIDIRLQLMKRKAVRSDLARTMNDDQSPSTLNHYVHLQERPIKQTITR
ncbi:hypothetical protein JD844_018384 [Phrynosoma platyrhinos]|uniref:PI3K-RBD domain-containing protein n=1 Tax=Phrynosoma platyrhinos TaxID=52577 RepID=A0ABQ7SNC4_PHRPL|nr:hypothetical protein JD844_018384 [Phrynosoma platyrhinos]